MNNSTIVFPNLRQVVDTIPPGGNSPRHAMAPKVLTTEQSWNKKRKLERQEKKHFEISANCTTRNVNQKTRTQIKTISKMVSNK